MTVSKKEAETEADQSDKVEAPVVEDDGTGYRGVQADKTPNEHYTVAGVIAGKPTPETDSK